MNERIKLLAEQAGIAVWGDAVYMYDPKDTLDSTVMAKFAELIVEECAELAKTKAFIIMQKAEEYAADKDEMIDATSAAFHLEILEQEIRKHFGVEE